MIKAYIDYPNATVTVHRNPNCSLAKTGPDQDIRHLLVNPDNLSRELGRFRGDAHKFGAEAGARDMFLILDFIDPVFEEALLTHLKRLIALNHEAFKLRAVQVHC